MKRDEAFRALQRLDRQVQQVVQQRNAYEAQLDEVREALRLLRETSGRAYKIIANLLVEESRETLIRELEEQVKKLEQRMSLLNAQEERLVREMQAYQEKLKGGGDGSA